MVTLKDIAEEANVSIMTVSNVINGKLNKVSKEKASLIQSIIKKRNYIQSAPARSLAKSNSNIIAIMLRSIKGENALSSPHNAAVVGIIIEEIQLHGYYAMVCMVESQEDIARNLRTWSVQGAIFIGMFDHEIEQIHSLSNSQMVFIDSYSKVRQLSNIGIDDYKGGQLAAEHLISMGHKNIAFISPSDDMTGVIQNRLLGFQSILKKKGLDLPLKYRLKLESDIDQRSLQVTVDTLIALLGEITAAFVTSDQMAASLIGALYLQGIRVPEDLSIIGFDNVLVSMQISPQLTTISQDLKQKAYLAVETLMNLLKNSKGTAELRILDVQLIQRHSVRKLV